MNEIENDDFIDYTKQIPEAPSYQMNNFGSGEIPHLHEAPRQAAVAVPQSPVISTPTYDDNAIERLKKENIEKQKAFDKQREIQQLMKESQRLDEHTKEMNKRFNPKFKITKEKARFYAIAAVVSITVAVIVVKIVQKVL